jgi:hypothetical protein
MGRIIMKVWLMVILFLIYPVIAQELPAISFSSTGKAATFLILPDNVVEVPVYILSVNNLSYADITLKFDNDVIYPERILAGDFNISYEIIEDKIVFLLNLNESFSGDLLLAKVVFKAIGKLGESSYLNLIVNELRNSNNKNMFYKTSSGIVNIGSEENIGKKEVDSAIQGLIEAENKTEFAEKNNLVVEDGKVKVKLTTDNGEEEKFVDINELENLTKNQSIKRIELCREYHWENYIIPILLVLIVIVLILTYKKLR